MPTTPTLLTATQQEAALTWFVTNGGNPNLLSEVLPATTTRTQVIATMVNTGVGALNAVWTAILAYLVTTAQSQLTTAQTEVARLQATISANTVMSTASPVGQPMPAKDAASPAQ